MRFAQRIGPASPRGAAPAYGRWPPQVVRNRLGERRFAGDAALLEQALLNLLENAAEAVAGQAGATIELSATEISAAIVLAVTDNGPGVAPDRVEEMFVPFYTTKAGGAGIGLTLARQIALGHGGASCGEAAGRRGPRAGALGAAAGLE